MPPCPSCQQAATKRHGRDFEVVEDDSASLLPQQAAYRAYANRLLCGQVLIIAPRSSPGSRRVLAKVAAALEANGRRVRTLPVERFRAASPLSPHRR